MKNIYFICVSALALAASASTICLLSGAPSTTNQAYSKVINPDIPQSVKLCNQTIDLDRTDMWERFDRELSSMIYGHGNTLLTIKRANKYFPRMAPILKSHGVPEDVLYLACIESYLDQRAYSPAKAAGIWQFIPSTAEQYGLEVSDEIDERYNLEKATAAACRLLKNSYSRFGCWESVMAAYNGGSGRISKESEAQGVNSAFDMHLVSETSRYVFRIMAMKTIMENPTAFGFNLKAEQLYQPVEFTEVEVSGPVADWPTWAKKHGITYAQLVEANPWIRAKKLTNAKKKTYMVKLPKAESLSRKKQDVKVFNHSWVN